MPNAEKVHFLYDLSRVLQQHGAYLWVNKKGELEYSIRREASDGLDLPPDKGIANFGDPKYNITASDILTIAIRLEQEIKNIETLYGN